MNSFDKFKKNCSNPVGVIQGRLLKKYKGRYQAHPQGYWEDEFSLAASIGLDTIEFILDYDGFEKNPLYSLDGIHRINNISKKTGVKVQTICADYFMEAPLHSKDSKISESSISVMIILLRNASKLGVTDIIIPCVDQSSLRCSDEIDRFVDKLSMLIPHAQRSGINFSLETDLDPQSFAKLLDRFNSDLVTVNYDIGNSAALGYNPIEELDAYGPKITDIHIKDRVYGGGPVLLGTGDAEIERFFDKLQEFNYEGPFIMQAYRDDEGIGIFVEQLNWINKYLK